MRKDENGYIVVETVGTFIPFVLLVISILSLVNIVTLQARVHNALTQAANTLSMYCYVLKAIDAADDLAMLDEKASGFKETIGSVLDGIELLSKGKKHSENNSIDPKAMVQSFANYGINELRTHVTAELVEPMVKKYLANGEMSGDEYLSSVRVESFDLTDCVLIDRNNNVRLTAEYEIEYTFGALRIPFGPTLKVKQTVVTKAWLGGSGEGYRR